MLILTDFVTESVFSHRGHKGGTESRRVSFIHLWIRGTRMIWPSFFWMTTPRLIRRVRAS